MGNVWIVPLTSNSSAKLTLLLFPYAGGSASVFTKWVNYLPKSINISAVQYPGRWERFNEPFMTEFKPLVDSLSLAIIQEIKGPFILLGYSLGALVAFEISRRFETTKKNIPLLLIAVSRNSPNYKSPLAHIHKLKDTDFISEVQTRYGGIPKQVLQDPEMMQIFLPILRNDLRLFELYVYQETGLLGIPTTVCFGKEDTLISKDKIQLWDSVCKNPVDYRIFNGSHFFTETSGNEFFSTLNSILYRRA